MLSQSDRPARAAHPRVDLDHRRGDLDHAGVEVDRAAGRQMIRPAGAVHHAADARCRWGSRRRPRVLPAPVEDDGELGLEPDGGERRTATARRADLAALRRPWATRAVMRSRRSHWPAS